MTDLNDENLTSNNIFY